MIVVQHCLINAQSLYNITYNNGQDLVVNAVWEQGDTVYLAGSRRNPSGVASNATDMFIFSVDKCSGDVIWEKSYRSSLTRRALYAKILPSGANSFYATGSFVYSGTARDYGVIDEFDFQGNLLNRHTFGDALSIDNQLMEILPISADTIALFTETNRSGTFQGTFSLFDKSTSSLTTTVGYSGGGRNVSNRAVAMTPDGGFISAGGLSNSSYTNVDFYIRKTDRAGNVVWQYGTSFASGNSTVEDIEPIHDGYLLTGFTDNFGVGGRDIFVQKIDTNGNLVWFNTYGGTGDDNIRDAIFIGSHLYICGNTTSAGHGLIDGLLVSINTSGNLMGMNAFGGSGDDYLNSIIYDGNNLYMAGQTNSFGSGSEAYLIKTDTMLSSSCDNMTIILNTMSHNIVYNPLTLPTTAGIITNSYSFSSIVSNASSNLTCNSNPPITISGPDTVCTYQTGVLFGVTYNSSFYDSITWSLYGGATTLDNLNSDSITIDFIGHSDSITCTLFSPCGDTLTLVHYLHIDTLSFDVIRDSVNCPVYTVYLDAGSSSIPYYDWSNGSSNQTIGVTQSGFYNVNKIDLGCVYIDTTYVNIPVKVANEVRIPNTFSPNSDGVNDLFSLSGYDPCKAYNMEIYNRWGTMLYETPDAISNPWNGKSNKNNKDLEEAIYYYVITSEPDEKYSGSLHLFR